MAEGHDDEREGDGADWGLLGPMVAVLMSVL